MTRRGLMTTTTVLLWVILSLLSHAPAARSQIGRGCCTSYQRQSVRFQDIKGYREQTLMENCRLKAIIFYTVRNTAVCATRRDAWVRRLLELLSSKLKKMAKVDAVAGKTQMRRIETPDGSTAVFSITQTPPNSTERFY